MTRLPKPTLGDDRTASAIVLAPILAQLEREGGDAQPILSAVGLSRRQLLDHELRIPESVRQSVWQMATAAAQDPYFGLRVAQGTKLGTYDVLDYATHWSVNLDDALCRVVRFHRLLSDRHAIEVRRLEEATSFRRREPASAVHAQECDCFFATIALRARLLLGRPLKLKSVRFSHAAPGDSRLYRALFGTQPIFGAKTNELVFRRRDLQARAHAPNPQLARLLDRYAGEMLARLPPLGDVVERLRFDIMRGLSSGKSALAAVARAQRKSPRTLQRLLTLRGTSYRQLLEEVRRETAFDLLQKTDSSVTEVAFLAGFASAAGFHRAFKGWTGFSPEQFRRASRPKPRASASASSSASASKASSLA
ncbi:MAG TPA: AraC family transcriptional regulator [Polyangiaceae bacterium]|nr:AraC family transcriptional regulator [Polyangiaceae bacterium]